MPTAIWKSRLRSGSAHWDLELAVEVRQCPLGSGARGGGPAVPTGIWTARRRRRVRRRRRRTALIKSNNPHLAGGEQRTKKNVNSLTNYCFDLWVLQTITKLTQLVNVGYRSRRQKGCTNFIMDPHQNSQRISLSTPFIKQSSDLVMGQQILGNQIPVLIPISLSGSCNKQIWR